MKYKNSYNVINPFNNKIVDQVPIHSETKINQILEDSFNFKSELKLNDKIEIFSRTIKNYTKIRKILQN